MPVLEDGLIMWDDAGVNLLRCPLCEKEVRNNALARASHMKAHGRRGEARPPGTYGGYWYKVKAAGAKEPT